MTENLLKGKKGVIMGLANSNSIAWGIAQAIGNAGAELAFTYQGDILKKRVTPLAESLGSNCILECDVTSEEQLSSTFSQIESSIGKIDFLIHSIAFSNKDELRGRFINTSQENFLNTMNISCYSFISCVREASKIMNEGGSCIAMSYYGAEKVVPRYNIMGVAKSALESSVRYLADDLGKDGIRVNAISAGPIKTLAAAGIGDFKYIFKWNESNAPLRKNVTIEEVGDSALYLVSDLSRAVTGEVLHVDSGYHVIGMKAVESPDIDITKPLSQQ